MSASFLHVRTDAEVGSGPGSEEAAAGAATGAAPVVVRRNAGLAALVGAAASAVAIAYLWRATEAAAPWDLALCLVMATVGATYLAHLVDARTPLLVADDLGVRVRLGNQWRGLPWDAVDRVVLVPERGLLRDGRLLFVPHRPELALDIGDHNLSAFRDKSIGDRLTKSGGTTGNNRNFRI